MAAFLPTVELTAKVQAALRGGWFTLSRGQWVSLNGGKGRLVSVSENGLRICWRFAGESFAAFNLRFKLAGQQKRQRFTLPKRRAEQLAFAEFSSELGNFDSLHVLMTRKTDGAVLCRSRRTHRLVIGHAAELQERAYIWRTNPQTGHPWTSFTRYPAGWSAVH